MTSFANRSRCSSWTSSGIPSGVAHTTRSLIPIVTRIAGPIDVVPVDAIPSADSVREVLYIRQAFIPVGCDRAKIAPGSRTLDKLDSHNSQVLLVDDEIPFATMLRYNLETHGFLVDYVTNGKEALSRIAKTQPHIVLLEWTLPGVSGIEVCRRLRSRPDTKDQRVIMVTGRTGDRNAIRGLNAGADDYMVKPVSVAELLARIRALLRRPQVFRAEGWLHWREIAMDLAAVRVTRNGREIRLGPTEFRLLKFRMQNPERVFSRQELIEAV
jgi:two-component system phosphate regulon response regulator PhoB